MGFFSGPSLRVYVLHVIVIFSTLTFSDGYTNTAIFWIGTEKKCRIGFSNKEKKNSWGISSFYMQNTNPVNGPTIVVEHMALDTALSPAILHTLKPTAAGKKNILSIDGVCCITFTLYGASSFLISNSLFICLSSWKGTDQQTQRFMSTFNTRETEKVKEGVLELHFFSTRLLNFISCLQKMEVEIWKILRQQLFCVSTILDWNFH